MPMGSLMAYLMAKTSPKEQHSMSIHNLPPLPAHIKAQVDNLMKEVETLCENQGQRMSDMKGTVMRHHLMFLDYYTLTIDMATTTMMIVTALVKMQAPANAIAAMRRGMESDASHARQTILRLITEASEFPEEKIKDEYTKFEPLLFRALAMLASHVEELEKRSLSITKLINEHANKED